MPAEARTPSLKTSAGAVRTACQSGARLATARWSPRPRRGEQQHRPVDRDFVGARDVIGGDRDDHAHERDAQEHAAAAPASETSRPRRSNAARVAARGAERDADRRFARARDGPRQQQPGDVGARDEEQQAGGAGAAQVGLIVWMIDARRSSSVRCKSERGVDLRAAISPPRRRTSSRACAGATPGSGAYRLKFMPRLGSWPLRGSRPIQTSLAQSMDAGPYTGSRNPPASRRSP